MRFRYSPRQVLFVPFFLATLFLSPSFRIGQISAVTPAPAATPSTKPAQTTESVTRTDGKHCSGDELYSKNDKSKCEVTAGQCKKELDSICEAKLLADAPAGCTIANFKSIVQVECVPTPNGGWKLDHWAVFVQPAYAFCFGQIKCR